MVDKLRTTQPLKITFSQGEQPTAQKLTALAEQSRSGAGVVENAIGDLWNQSGDYILSSHPLQLPNLARMIGEGKYLNPVIYPTGYTFKFRDHTGLRNNADFTNLYSGHTSGYLKFPPKSTAHGDLAFYDTSGQFQNQVDEEWKVGDPNKTGGLLPGEYYLASNGRWRTASPMLANEKIEYDVELHTDTLFTDGALPGVIPDPRQTEFTGCRVSESGGKHYLHLPPRRPLSINFGADLGEYGGPADFRHRLPSGAELGLSSGNEATSTALPLRFYQAATSDALDHEHYRYRLPKEILDIHGTLDPGAEYPQGFMYIYDQATNTILSDVKFKKPSDGNLRKWIIEVSSDTVDFSSYISVPSNETETNYNSTGLSLIVCGVPIARALWNLANRFDYHIHDNDTDLTRVVTHNNLGGLDPVPNNPDHTGRFPNYLPNWSPSRWADDDHIGLLSRAGAQDIVSPDGGEMRDINNNAMLGHIIMANTVPDVNNIFLDSTLPDTSFRMYFGDIGGPVVFGLDEFTVKVADTLAIGNDQAEAPATLNGSDWGFAIV